MRQPTFSRSRRRPRSKRLLRTGLILVVLVGVAALVGNLIGSKNPTSKPEEKIGQVAFVSDVRSESDGSEPAAAAVQTERRQIDRVLDDWYQRAFIDTAQYGTGTFSRVAEHFTKQARASFTADLDTLTIGEARAEVRRVDPRAARARITLYFTKGTGSTKGVTPKFAVVRLRFLATGLLKDSAAMPLAIESTATLTMEKDGEAWLVNYYEAKQTQNSVVTTASPSP